LLYQFNLTEISSYWERIQLSLIETTNVPVSFTSDAIRIELIRSERHFLINDRS
jgi:hypothetical protein